MAVGVKNLEGQIGPRDLSKAQREPGISSGFLSFFVNDSGCQRLPGVSSMTRGQSLHFARIPLGTGRTRGCSWAAFSAVLGTLVTEAFSLAAAPVFRLLGALVLNSRVPLEASDLESSTMAAVRWRGGAMVQGGSQKLVK